jgi:hypothetical protein
LSSFRRKTSHQKPIIGPIWRSMFHIEKRSLIKAFLDQGCQMVYFQTKNPNLGKFWMALKWKRLLYSLAIWTILRPFITYYVCPFGKLVAIWYIFQRFVILCQEKSGNPVLDLVTG